MEFENFIDMGGYAGFVWGAYALAIAVYAALMLYVLRKGKTAKDKKGE